MSTRRKPAPLSAVRVLDFTSFLGGPYAGMLLADLGDATVAWTATFDGAHREPAKQILLHECVGLRRGGACLSRKTRPRI